MALISAAQIARLKEVWKNMSKMLVFVYLVFIACVSGYFTCTLWMASAPDCPSSEPCSVAKAAENSATESQNTQTRTGGTANNASAMSAAPTRNSPPECTDNAGDPPKITVIEPNSVEVGDNYVNVVIYGCNFKPDTKLQSARTVKFNGVDRDGQLVGDHEFVVPLRATDFSAPGKIAATVTTAPQAAAPTPSGMAARDNTANLVTSNVAHLTIKAASDVTAVWKVFGGKKNITLELRLILLILSAGALSAAISGLKSFVDYAGDKKLEPNWFPFYCAEPFVGSGLAFVFYLVVRGGFMAGTSVDVKAVNPYGFVAVAALVGMFSDAAYRKLNDVADTIFKTNRDTRGGTLLGLAIDVPDELPPATRGSAYSYTLKAKDGTPPYTWSSVTTPLPGGLVLSADGVLSGTPPQIGVAITKVPFTVQVKDSQSKIVTKEVKLTIN